MLINLLEKRYLNRIFDCLALSEFDEFQDEFLKISLGLSL